jgi:propionyl-CoA carboxylase alpha chain
VVGKDQSFYFLEMNTRLQVEHPVTESITGVDLVEQMIRVAAGEPLPFTQEQIPRRGWAIECRINAEDPFRSFLPSTGRLVRYAPPPTTMHAAMPVPEGGGVRVDTGVAEGCEIPMYYDSMIAKLIVHGQDRQDAIARMREALNGFVIRGVSSNIPFQSALLAHPDFVSGNFNTGFIAANYGQGFRAEDVPHDNPDFLVALAAAAYCRYRERAAGIGGQLAGHEVKIGEDFTVVVKREGGEHQHHTVRVVNDGSICVTLSGKTYAIASDWRFGGIRATGQCNGRPFTAQVERRGLWTVVQHNGLKIEAMVMVARAAELLRLMPFKPPADMSKFLLSPMPGLLVQVTVKPGQAVQAGERLAVIEAMKMENILVAAQDGTVQSVLANAGEQRLRSLWVDMLGLTVKSTFVSERENVDEDICALGTGPHAVEVDLMQPIDPDKKPAVHATPLNHVGLWVDDLPKAVAWMVENGVRFAPGGIRKGAAGHDICFIHPKGNDEFPVGGEGVLIELVQAPPEVVAALG